MKILFVSQSILPYKGGSSIIIENLVKNFSASEVVVIGARKLIHQKNTGRTEEDAAKFQYFFSELSIFGRGARFFDWFRKLRFKTLIRFIEQTIISENIDQVIGVYPNAFYCLAASRAARNLDIPFSSYFHNTYVENTEIKDPDAATIQKEIFDHSKFIFVMSEGMKHFYERKYGQQKFIPLVHTHMDKAVEIDKPFLAKEQYNLVAIGNFNESNIDATRRFIAAIENDDRFKLSVYTHVPKLLLEQRGISVDKIEYKGFIHPDLIQETLSTYDICVLTHGFEGGYGPVEYETIFPTRTIPFLLSGKPIIVHAPPNSFLSKFIRANSCGALVDTKDETTILSTLNKIIEDKNFRDEIIKGARETSKDFYGPHVVANFKETLLI